MPRRRKKKHIPRGSQVRGSQGPRPVPGISNELPQTAEACVKEMELLEEHNRVVMDRMKMVTAQLQHALRKESKSSPTQNLQTSVTPVEEEAAEKRTNRSESYEQGCEMDSDTENEEQKEASNANVYSLAGSDKWDDMLEENLSSPLISALKKLQQRRDQRRGIKMWSQNLANLFWLIDEDQSGYIDEQEYHRMIGGLDISEELKVTLRNKFHNIDKDGNGINLNEFLMFFLNFPMFQEELLTNAHINAPYIYEKNLSCTQRGRQWLYCVVEHPDYNGVSKVLFCMDLILTLVPIVILCTEGGLSSIRVRWFKHTFMWVVSIFFATEYFCGLITCKYKKKFIFDVVHTFELISFLFWIYYNTIGRSDTLEPMGFVVFRVIRYINLHKVFKLSVLEEDINIYVNTLHLAYTSSGAVIVLLIFTIFLFSIMMYVFERGVYNADEKWWERDADEGESPFADISSCIYFVIVTMTTLGYGDLYPISYVGRIVGMITVFVGLCNITFLINIVGDCFEEVFREFIAKRSIKLEEEHSKYLEACLHDARSGNRKWLSFRSKKKGQRKSKMLEMANERLR